MYGHSDPDSFLEAAASRGHRGFGRPKPKTGAKSRAGFTNGRTAPILELAAGSLDFAPSGRLADRPVSLSLTLFGGLVSARPCTGRLLTAATCPKLRLPRVETNRVCLQVSIFEVENGPPVKVPRRARSGTSF